ncbi:MAG: hypothetical protein PHN80_03470 [Hespellia sp.]|nr:hypothetical protein [Hespellia sp.]
MKIINKTFGKITVLFYLLALYHVWQLCQYGGMISNIIRILFDILALVVCIVLWLISYSAKPKEPGGNRVNKKVLAAEIIVCLIGTMFFGARIVYSAAAYQGKLSWKLDQIKNERMISLSHNNFFETGVNGVLADLDKELNLPAELYISDSYEMSFDQDGTIQFIYTILYGKNAEGKTQTYVVNYNADDSKKMTVWIGEDGSGDYSAEMSLNPMLRILENVDCQKEIKEWGTGGDIEYEILYYGRRSFETSEGLEYLPGDADGDGRETGVGDSIITRLQAGGSAVGYELSLYIPEAESVTPKRFIMEPEYVTAEEISREKMEEQIENAKQQLGQYSDQTDGSMYYFLDKNTGWRLAVTDAAAGSRSYALELTKDGGTTWERINENPFPDIGVAEGLEFFTDQFGFAGLAGASQSASQIYVTKDGGVSWTKCEFPMDTVTRLPEHAADYNLGRQDYAYLTMPEWDGFHLKVTAMSGAGEEEGILFQSNDNGETWIYAGVSP